MTADSYTNSSLAAARRCLTEYDLRYELQLEPDRDEDREALQVGTSWHKAHEARALGGDPFLSITTTAPGPLWAEKLARLFAAYEWYWRDQKLKVIEPERQFTSKWGGRTFRGKIDGLIEIDGRRGLHEIKTTGDSVADESSYWDRLRMDVQVGLYSLTLPDLPSFILYDVTAKPSIAPKAISKADVTRMEGEIARKGEAVYFGEKFAEADIRPALNELRESIALYGARLTADIGDRPERYFARREIARTTRDYDTLRQELSRQVDLLTFAKANGLMHRNPDQCTAFGICDFFKLCSNNIRPTAGEPPPAGFRRRPKLHPELD